jgi:hypothetical protein
VAKDAALVIDSITITNGDPGVVNEGSLDVYRSTIAFNGSHQGGAGIYNSGPGSRVYLQDSTVNDNGSHHGPGAGISNADGFVEIVFSTIYNNWISPDTSYGGGGIANGSSNAVNEKGELVVEGGTLSIANSTIYGNVDHGIDRPFPHAGGIVNDGTGEVWLGNVTITNNMGSNFTDKMGQEVYYSGGVFSSEDSGGLHFFNTIIAGNGRDYLGPDCGGIRVLFGWQPPGRP